VNLGSFYLLGIPMAILLGFVLRMGSRGLWMGIVCGSLSQTTLMSAITFFTDWNKMVRCSFLRSISMGEAAHGLLLLQHAKMNR
jgi:multidrug resistance protein, MATE family